MKKYIIGASLFFANNEIITWAVLCVMGFMLLIDIASAAAREGKTL